MVNCFYMTTGALVMQSPPIRRTVTLPGITTMAANAAASPPAASHPAVIVVTSYFCDKGGKKLPDAAADILPDIVDRLS